MRISPPGFLRDIRRSSHTCAQHRNQVQTNSKTKTAATPMENQAIRLGDIAPDFVAETTEGTIQFHKWLGNSWGILFSHPADFTPVCTTELGELAKLRDDFDKRNVKVISISADPVSSHEKWILDINETQKTKVNYP